MRDYPLFQSHIDLAHSYWERLVLPNNTIIDATCGNGHDTLFLASLNPGTLYACDIQEKAISTTKEKLGEHHQNVKFVLGCHSSFPEKIEEGSVKLIVYNLGYLPGGDKAFTTELESTLESIKSARDLIAPGGAISITCYPGHPEGAKEEEKLLEECSKLDPKKWNCCHHRWLNRKNSPSLLFLQHSR